MEYSFAARVTYYIRDLRAKKLFTVLRQFCRGAVLDIGGRDFFTRISRDPEITFDSWVNVEMEPSRLPGTNDPRYQELVGDGCHLEFADNSFDTVLNIQVLEHTFTPNVMMAELARVLKPGGNGILLIPISAVMHMAPQHYYNFTLFWIMEAVRQNQLQLEVLQPIGGLWSTTASHMVYLFLHAFRISGYSTSEIKRSWLFYILFPFMALWACITIVVAMIFSLGDLAELPNNYIVVVKK